MRTNGCAIGNYGNGDQTIKRADGTAGGVLAGMPLEKLRDKYRNDLLERCLPFCYKHLVDHEFGGFWCYAEYDGRPRYQEKTTMFIGRGIWTFSFLYRNFVSEEKYLEAARKGIDFILKHEPAGDSLFPDSFTRSGEPIKAAETIYGGLFVAEGLAEFAEATGDKKYLNLAKEILLKCVRIYDRPDYYPNAGKVLGPDTPPFPGLRFLAAWMLLLRISTPMLERVRDPEIEKIAARCLDAIINYHYNPSFGLTNEVINHDLSRLENDFSQYVVTGHAIETLWMVLHEAVRRRDGKLFDTAAERFRRHVEIALDRVYGGIFHAVNHVDKNIWVLDKAFWAQVEVLVGALILIEHKADPWAKRIFDDMYRYIEEKYTLTRYNCPMWSLGGGRSMAADTLRPGTGDHYHQPRQLMLNLLSLERMIKRSGKVSGLVS